MINDILSDWQRWQLTDQRPAPDHIRSLPGGLTNQCYLLTLATGEYVLRIEGQNSAALDINRDAEFNIHKLAAKNGLTPPIHYRSPQGHYWIRDFVPGKPLHNGDLTLPVLQQMLQQLQALHQLVIPVATPQLDIGSKAACYWNILKVQRVGDELLSLKEPLQTLMSGMPDQRRCLCHMDPLPANWITTPDHSLVLLDWEYAALGHPLWDLAALLQSAELTSQAEQTLLNSCGVIHNNHSWITAKAQIQYLTGLWYGAQKIWSEAKLTAELKILLRTLNNHGA